MNAWFERAIFLGLGLILTAGAWGEDEKAKDRPWYDGFSFEAGITGNHDTLKIMPNTAFVTDAQMVPKDSISYSPYIQLATRDGYFGSSSFGYNVFATYKSFSFDYQETIVGSNFVNRDLGTSATGYYFFVTPQIFFDFWRSDNTSAKLGAGYGFGRISAKGTYRSGNLPGSPIQSFSVGANGYAPGVMAELRYKSLVGRFYGIQTNVDGSNGDKYHVYRAGGDIGYRWSF